MYFYIWLKILSDFDIDFQTYFIDNHWFLQSSCIIIHSMALSSRYYGFFKLTHTIGLLKTTGILIEHRLLCFWWDFLFLFLFRIYQISMTRIRNTMLFFIYAILQYLSDRPYHIKFSNLDIFVQVLPMLIEKVILTKHLENRNQNLVL